MSLTVGWMSGAPAAVGRSWYEERKARMEAHKAELREKGVDWLDLHAAPGDRQVLLSMSGFHLSIVPRLGRIFVSDAVCQIRLFEFRYSGAGKRRGYEKRRAMEKAEAVFLRLTGMVDRSEARLRAIGRKRLPHPLPVRARRRRIPAMPMTRRGESAKARFQVYASGIRLQPVSGGGYEPAADVETSQGYVIADTKAKPHPVVFRAVSVSPWSAPNPVRLSLMDASPKAKVIRATVRTAVASRRRRECVRLFGEVDAECVRLNREARRERSAEIAAEKAARDARRAERERAKAVLEAEMAKQMQLF